MPEMEERGDQTERAQQQRDHTAGDRQCAERLCGFGTQHLQCFGAGDRDEQTLTSSDQGGEQQDG